MIIAGTEPAPGVLIPAAPIASMAELLIRIIDKVNANDPVANTKLFKRGDVVALKPDGWAWSALELSSPWWCLVKVPGAAVADLSDLLAPETGDPSDKTLRVRSHSFDLDAYASDTGAKIPAAVTAFERRKAPRSGPSRAALPAVAKATVLTRYMKVKS